MEKMVLTERRNWPLLNPNTPQFVSKRKERWNACSDKVGEVAWSSAPAHFGLHSFMTRCTGEAGMDHTVRPSKIGLEQTGADRCEYFMDSVGQRVSGSSFPMSKPRNAKDIAAEITAVDMYRGWRNATDSAAGPYSSFDMDPTFDMEPGVFALTTYGGAHAKRQMDPNAEVFVPTTKAAPHGRHHLCDFFIKATQADRQIKCLREDARKNNVELGLTRKRFESLRPRTCDEVLAKCAANGDSRRKQRRSRGKDTDASLRACQTGRREGSRAIKREDWNGVNRKGLKYRGLLSHQPRHELNGRFLRS